MIEWFTAREWHLDIAGIAAAAALIIVVTRRTLAPLAAVRPLALGTAVYFMLGLAIGPFGWWAIPTAALALGAHRQQNPPASRARQFSFVATTLCSLIAVWATVPDTEAAVIAAAVVGPVMIAERATLRCDRLDNVLVLGSLAGAVVCGFAGRAGAVAGSSIILSSQAGQLLAFAAPPRRIRPEWRIVPPTLALLLHGIACVAASRVFGPVATPHWPLIASQCVMLTTVQAVLASVRHDV
jgi:hypothetical protein